MNASAICEIELKVKSRLLHSVYRSQSYDRREIWYTRQTFSVKKLIFQEMFAVSVADADTFQ